VQGCGSCAVACPSGAASIFHYDDEQVLTCWKRASIVVVTQSV